MVNAALIVMLSVTMQIATAGLDAAPRVQHHEQSAGAGSPDGDTSTPSGASVLDGVFSSDQASRGEETFRRVCMTCHDTGDFSGGRFRLSWVGRTAGDLFETMSTLMPEADPGSLSPGQYASLLAYLLRLNGYPPGEHALPADLAALRQMQIVTLPAP